MWACSRCKNVKYSRSEGCRINLATLTFFNLDWQVNCQDGNILSSSRFLSIPLWSRVALHHVCQRGLYWRTLGLDWMLDTHWCVWKGGVHGGWYWAEWLYWICRVSLSLTSHAFSQSLQQRCIELLCKSFKKKKDWHNKLLLLHFGLTVNGIEMFTPRLCLVRVLDHVLAVSGIFPTLQLYVWPYLYRLIQVCR